MSIPRGISLFLFSLLSIDLAASRGRSELVQRTPRRPPTNAARPYREPPIDPLPPQTLAPSACNIVSRAPHHPQSFAHPAIPFDALIFPIQDTRARLCRTRSLPRTSLCAAHKKTRRVACPRASYWPPIRPSFCYRLDAICRFRSTCHLIRRTAVP